MKNKRNMLLQNMQQQGSEQLKDKREKQRNYLVITYAISRITANTKKVTALDLKLKDYMMVKLMCNCNVS